MDLKLSCQEQPHPRFRRLVTAAILTLIVVGLAGPQAAQNQAQQGNKADALPINPLVQELRNQAMQGVQFFPPYSPTPLARTDATARVKEWQDKQSQGVQGQPAPRANGVFTVKGTSVFMLEREGDAFIASWGIPTPDGKITTKGAVWQERNQDPTTGRLVLGSPALSGAVWTPRTPVIGKLDLTGTGNTTTSPDFSLDAFKNSTGVIPFANGYAVNLFGQKLDEQGVVDAEAHPKGNYLTDDGKPLYGRLIRIRSGELDEKILRP